MDLPVPPQPVGAYEAGIIHNGVGFISGQFPIRDGGLTHVGRIGVELSENEGLASCETAAMNVLAQLSTLTDGFERLEGLFRLDGYVASADSFFDQPKILNAASDLFVDVLKDKGRHARTAFSVPRLPLNAPIELGLTFAVRS